MNAVGWKLELKSVRIESLRQLVGPTPKGVRPTSWHVQYMLNTKGCWAGSVMVVDMLWQYYFAESAGKIRSKAEGWAGRRERAKELKSSGRSGG